MHTLRYQESFVNVILCNRVRDSCDGDVQIFRLKYSLAGVPRGMTGCHLETSLHTASTNGRRRRSSNVGSRSRPVTASSSCWAFLMISGWSAIAKKNVIIAATVYI